MDSGIGQKYEKTLLLVDDSHDLRQVLADFLTSKGFVVLQASSGLAALAILQEHAVDIIISDIQMPDGDGFALLRELPASSPSHPPVVFMSGNVTLGVDDMKKMGVSHFISKPFDSNVMLLAITTLMA